MREIKIFSFHVIKDPTCSTNKDIYTSSELIGLIIYRNTTIYSKYIKFVIVMFLCIEFLSNLES